jgi:hypothetical protein
MTAAGLAKRISELAPLLADVRAEIHPSGKSGYAVATKAGLMRCSYWESGLKLDGVVLRLMTDDEVAAKVAKELMA